MESDKLIEAMARAMRAEEQRNWIELGMDEDVISLATAALKALRDTLEPVGWLHTHPDQPLEIEFFRLTNHDKVSGWTETPLFALPEVKP